MKELTSEDWLNIVQTIGVIFTLVFAIVQMRKSERASKSNSMTNIYHRLDMINSLEFQNAELLKELSRPFNEKEDIHKPMNSYLDMVKTLYYELYIQHKKFKQIDRDEWKVWEITITKFYSQPYVSGYWMMNRDEYEKGFAQFIEDIIERNKKSLPAEIKTEMELNLEEEKVSQKSNMKK